MPDRHPSVENLLRWFEFHHLPDDLQSVSEPFHGLAYEMADSLPECPELSAGLRKLLEAKDCCVRAAIEARDA